MLVELAVCDSYGGAFEYTEVDFVKKNNDLLGFKEHPKWKDQLNAGQYTDDTQMTIAIAEAVLSGVLTKKLIADKIVECYKRDPRNSYARSFNKFLQEIQTGDEFLGKIKPNSDKSGAAMRASPIGLFPSIPEVLEKSKLQATLTHDTPNGIQAAQAAALLVHYFAYDLGKKEDLGKFVEKHVPNNWTSPWSGKVGQKGWHSTKAAITLLVSCSSLSEILKEGVEFTGDVDTVCTIAGAAASFSKEIKNDLPLVLVQNLENGSYGRDYLKKLDGLLLSKFGLKAPDSVWDVL